jgi:hypothetical protein
MKLNIARSALAQNEKRPKTCGNRLLFYPVAGHWDRDGKNTISLHLYDLLYQMISTGSHFGNKNSPHL